MTGFFSSDKVSAVRELYQPLIDAHPSDGRVEAFISGHIDLAWEAFQSADERIVVEISNFHPEFIGAEKEQIFSSQISFNEIQNVILEQYGFIGWYDVKEAGKFDSRFEMAVNRLIEGDLQELGNLIEHHKTLLNQASQFGHNATLIQYLGANGIEIWRQIVPYNAPEILDFLLARGADPAHPNNIYGGSDLRSLIETSDHPLQAGVDSDLLALL